MAAFTRTIDVGEQICNIFGLESRKTKEINLVFEPNSIVIVTAKQFVYEHEMRELVETMKRYKMVEKPESQQVQVIDGQLAIEE